MGCLKTAYKAENKPVLRCVWNAQKQGKIHVNCYDYGARFYDPVIGRFTCLDPIAEEFYYVSPYNYAENSPIANVDLWGLQALNAQIWATLQATKIKYTAIAQQGGGSLMNLVVGSTRTDRIPSEVRSSMSSGTQSMINFSGKVSDAANVAETASALTKEVAYDAGELADQGGSALSYLGIGLAPFTGGASLVLTGVGTTVSTTGNGIKATVNLVEGDADGAMKEVVTGAFNAATGKGASAAIKASVKNEAITTSTEMATQGTILHSFSTAFNEIFNGLINREKPQDKKDEEQR